MRSERKTRGITRSATVEQPVRRDFKVYAAVGTGVGKFLWFLLARSRHAWTARGVIFTLPLIFTALVKLGLGLVAFLLLPASAVWLLVEYKMLVFGPVFNRRTHIKLHETLSQIDENRGSPLGLQRGWLVPWRDPIVTREYPARWLKDDQYGDEVSKIIEMTSARLGREMHIDVDRAALHYTLYPAEPLDSYPWRQGLGEEDHRYLVGTADSYKGGKAYIDFERAPAWLISGAPDAGKTTLLHSLNLSVIERRTADLYMLDGKRTGAFRYVDPGNDGIHLADEIEEFVPWSDRLRKLVEDRYSQLKSESLRSFKDPDRLVDFQAIVVVLDEVVAVAQLLETQGDTKGRDRFLTNIDYVISQGRQCRVWTVWATQRPSAKSLGSVQTRENTMGRIALGHHDVHASRMVMPEYAAVLQRVHKGKGYGLMSVAGETPYRIQTFLAVSPTDLTVAPSERKAQIEAMDEPEREAVWAALEQHDTPRRADGVTRDSDHDDVAKIRCQGVKTRTGTRCQRSAQEGSDYCPFHQDQAESARSVCAALVESTGKRCTHQARNGSEYCGYHKKHEVTEDAA